MDSFTYTYSPSSRWALQAVWLFRRDHFLTHLQEPPIPHPASHASRGASVLCSALPPPESLLSANSCWRSCHLTVSHGPHQPQLLTHLLLPSGPVPHYTLVQSPDFHSSTHVLPFLTPHGLSSGTSPQGHSHCALLCVRKALLSSPGRCSPWGRPPPPDHVRLPHARSRPCP